MLACVQVVPLLVQSEPTSAGSGSTHWQFALGKNETECYLVRRSIWLLLG